MVPWQSKDSHPVSLEDGYLEKLAKTISLIQSDPKIQAFFKRQREKAFKKEWAGFERPHLFKRKRKTKPKSAGIVEMVLAKHREEMKILAEMKLLKKSKNRIQKPPLQCQICVCDSYVDHLLRCKSPHYRGGYV